MTAPALKFLDNFREDSIHDINNICALFNSLKFVSILDGERKERYNKLTPKIQAIIGKFWTLANNENFAEKIRAIKVVYYDDLLEMLTKYKMLDRIDKKIVLNSFK